MRHRTRLLAAVAIAAALALTGCTSQSDGLSADYNQGDDGGNYVSGDGTMVVIAADQRSAAVDFGGDTDTGETLSSDDLRGSVVVLNFWYAQCGPCRTEAPDLVELHAQYADASVEFVGVNVRDGIDEARTFAAKFGIVYPSILDVDDNNVVLAFAGNVPPNAVPTTLILDAEGRVAARISGAIQSPTAVSDVIDDLLAEA